MLRETASRGRRPAGSSIAASVTCHRSWVTAIGSTARPGVVRKPAAAASEQHSAVRAAPQQPDQGSHRRARRRNAQRRATTAGTAGHGHERRRLVQPGEGGGADGLPPAATAPQPHDRRRAAAHARPKQLVRVTWSDAGRQAVGRRLEVQRRRSLMRADGADQQRAVSGVTTACSDAGSASPRWLLQQVEVADEAVRKNVRYPRRARDRRPPGSPSPRSRRPEPRLPGTGCPGMRSTSFSSSSSGSSGPQQ